LAHELEKAGQKIEHFQEMLAQKDKEIACLRELLEVFEESAGTPRDLRISWTAKRGRPLSPARGFLP